MELTRRDAIAALAAIGGTGAGAVSLTRLDGDSSPDEPLPTDSAVRETLIAVAEVVYPAEVTGIDSFVGAVLDSRLAGDAHGRGIREAVAVLNERSASWYDDRVVDLSPDRREQLLREMGVDSADEDPEGRTAQRVRYYVVNEVLLALYTSPTGGKLVGIENPQGHAGGTASYQQGPR